MSAIQTFFQGIRGDRYIWGITVVLAFASIMSTYSAVSSMAYKNNNPSVEILTLSQLFYLVIGVIAAYTCYRFHYMVYSKLSKIIFWVTVILLIYTLFYGVEINYARRWIRIPFLNNTIQTSDLAKIGLVIYLAKGLSKRQMNIKDFKAFLPLLMPVILVCMLIAPSDLSTAAMIFMTSIMMMFIGRVQIKYLLSLFVIAGIVLGIIVLIGMAFPELVRVDTWANRISYYFADGGHQIQQSKMAIANGHIFGQGPGGSVQKNYLAFAYADFIYAVICEEYGLIGGVLILLLYLGLLYRCTVMVTSCPKTFGVILAYGLCLSLTIQAFLNIAVSVHLVPATGLTLPLISRGGSSIVFSCISLGIILSVSKYVQEARRKRLELIEMEKLELNASNN